MTERPSTPDLILSAAQWIIRERGPEKLTMSAVAAAAGLSRPTLYRWFPTKTLLLAAISAYEVEQFDLGLEALASAHDDPAARFDACLRYLVTYLDETIGPNSISADPAFALQSLADSLTPHCQSVATVLGDALDELPSVRSGRLAPQQGAEILLRVAYSHYLVPNANAEELITALRAFAGLRPPDPRRNDLRHLPG